MKNNNEKDLDKFDMSNKNAREWVHENGKTCPTASTVAEKPETWNQPELFKEFKDKETGVTMYGDETAYNRLKKLEREHQKSYLMDGQGKPQQTPTFEPTI